MIATIPNIEIDGLYTIAQTSRALDVSRQTIRRHILSGDIETHGRLYNSGTMKVLIKGADIIKFWKNDW
jgi:hypothetical protein